MSNEKQNYIKGILEVPNLTPEEVKELDREAVEFSNKPYYSNGFKLSVAPRLYLKRGYFAGALIEKQKASIAIAKKEIQIDVLRQMLKDKNDIY